MMPKKLKFLRNHSVKIAIFYVAQSAPSNISKQQTAKKKPAHILSIR